MLNDPAAPEAPKPVAVFRQNLEGLIPDGLLVRISAVTTDRALAEATVKRFAATMIAAEPPAGKRLLLG